MNHNKNYKIIKKLSRCLHQKKCRVMKSYGRKLAFGLLLLSHSVSCQVTNSFDEFDTAIDGKAMPGTVHILHMINNVQRLIINCMVRIQVDGV